MELTSPGEEFDQGCGPKGRQRRVHTVHYYVKGSLEPGSQHKHNSYATPGNIILYSSARDLTVAPTPALMKYKDNVKA